ncbi:putative capsule polysaccharide biosynthesis protein [Rosellinia necatrix]|uniref:Putative capsule polysaccharide biosynthesis protein n=1 Tax=Rosellinia necatrix TaxID=77044 RepID=A0A1W2TV98_ROSNE|nr:putative capsule polysaccharide biosynthesis protein [Rosellinia necatrix]
MAKFALPQSATGLRAVPESRLDLRPEAEILADLRSFRPVTSEKNVWCFWDKGLDRMYPSYRCTVVNWVRKLGPSWTVRLVDVVEGSPNHVYNYAGRDWFPSCFVEGTMDGRHAAQHAADLVRLPLLYEHGGVWMDVGNMLHTHLDELFWDALTAPGSPYEMGVWIITGQIRRQWGSFGNYMMAARKGCVFVRSWHASYAALWRGGRTNCAGFHASPLVRDIGIADGMLDGDFRDRVHEMSDYVAQMLLGDRTRNLLDVGTGWSGRAFWERHVFMVEGIVNGILGSIRTGHDGRRQAELFTTPLDDPDDGRRAAAEAFVVDMLENSHMYKVYHNPAGGLPALGDVIKRDGFRDADHRPGTYGELYRYGTVHWESTRGVERLVPQPTTDKLIRATPTTPAMPDDHEDQ